MDERNVSDKHSLSMQNRAKMELTGVTDVISFDEDMVVAETNLGIILVKGEDLHINRLNLEKGELDIEGHIVNITYEETGSFSSPKGSLFSKIFK